MRSSVAIWPSLRRTSLTGEERQMQSRKKRSILRDKRYEAVVRCPAQCRRILKENLGKDIALVTSQVNATRSRIVQSPDRIRKYISEMSLQARDERAAIAAAEAKSREIKVKLDALSVFEQVSPDSIDMLRDLFV